MCCSVKCRACVILWPLYSPQVQCQLLSVRVMTYSCDGETRFWFSNNNGSLGSNWMLMLFVLTCIPLMSCIYCVVYRCACVSVCERERVTSRVLYTCVTICVPLLPTIVSLSCDTEVLHVNVESFRVLRSCLVTSTCDNRACIECTCTVWWAMVAWSELCVAGYYC